MLPHPPSACCPARSGQFHPGFSVLVFIPPSDADADADAYAYAHPGADAKRQRYGFETNFLPVASERPTSTLKQKLIVDYSLRHLYSVLPNVIARKDRNTASMSGVDLRHLGESEKAPP